MAYLLDADSMIAAKRLHYGFDFCPAYWDWIVREHGAGCVFSIEKVGDDLAAGADELSEWAENLGSSFFLKPDAATVQALGTVSSWVASNGYEPAAVNTFLGVSDSYLAAQALAGGHTVVTHEKTAQSVKRIKIPNVCIGLGIKVMSPFEMLRVERARFVLEALGNESEVEA
ncbi:MAG: DUF4411 family protein [Fimbriimonadaceae bacterium]|nr:MAG: hypothetical protein UZ18_ATM001002029 [Armatimonadetes bacterium OLB18]WKZ80292.1 MAG: DUF4411 family protein [Fimbriimonadaceae bacterium]